MRTINQSVQFVVFEGAEHSENAIKLINYLATEEGMLLAEFGIEDEHWVRGEDGKPVSLLTTESEKAEVGTGSCAWVHRLSYFNAAFSDAYDADRAIMKDSVQKTYVMPTTESYKDNSANLGSIQSTYFAEIVCNPDIDFDATVDKYIKEWNEAGGAEWTKEINEYWSSRK